MIIIKKSGKRVESNPVTSILNILQRNDIPIETYCGGRAKCGRCLLHIAAGADKMNPRGKAEIELLRSLGAGENMRLACQSYARGEVEIEIINPGK